MVLIRFIKYILYYTVVYYSIDSLNNFVLPSFSDSHHDGRWQQQLSRVCYFATGLFFNPNYVIIMFTPLIKCFIIYLQINNLPAVISSGHNKVA